jgi:AcrR family transcriptional regulator
LAETGRGDAVVLGEGLEADSIPDLIQALGIGAPSLHAAFGSKEALCAEALNSCCESNASFV